MEGVGVVALMPQARDEVELSGPGDEARVGRSLTNIGRWPDSAEDWGPVRATRGFFQPSFDDASFSVFAVQTVAGRTWMSSRTHACGTSVDDVERLGAAMIDDARSLAR